MADSTACNYKLLIFDWDGTLINSFEKLWAGVRFSAYKHQLPIPPKSQFQKLFGGPAYEVIDKLFPGLSQPKQASVLNQFYEFIYKHDQLSPLFENVPNVLKILKNQHYWITLATAKRADIVHQEIKQHKIDDCFYQIITANETRPKPHPKMIHVLLDNFAVKPSQALMIGDTYYDMAIARNARIHKALVQYGYGDLDKIKQTFDIMHLIERPDHLLTLLA